MKTELKNRIKKIKLLVCDVDGVLTDGGAFYSGNGLELKRFSIRDGMGITLLRKAGYHIAIVTTENTKIVEKRASVLKITDLYQGVVNKIEALEDLLQKYSLTWSEVAYIGDDVNDLPVLEKAGLAVVPRNGQAVNKKLAHYITKADGGHGCVREVCDLLLDLNWKGKKIAELWLSK
ncbi:MAG: HAD-IIIA family hydrolase [Bacteroidetes bacterium]|nr:HAD-IIIA family hydrolase [Bacteroidota bacterium]